MIIIRNQEKEARRIFELRLKIIKLQYFFFRLFKV